MAGYEIADGINFMGWTHKIKGYPKNSVSEIRFNSVAECQQAMTQLRVAFKTERIFTELLYVGQVGNRKIGYRFLGRDEPVAVQIVELVNSDWPHKLW